MACRMTSFLGLALILGACSTSSESDTATPAQGQAAQLQAPSMAAVLTADAECRRNIGKELGGGDDRCKITKEDCDVLKEIDETNNEKFAQPLDLSLLASLATQYSIMSAPTAAAWFTPYCDQSECRIPVVIKPRSGPLKRCQATLPYLRYCVRPTADKLKPQRLVFYLASLVAGQPVALKKTDNFEFVDPPQIGPRPYHTANVAGLDLHEDDGPGRRRPMQKNYFESEGRSADGLEFTWKVTTSTVNTAGMIGRIPDGVLSAAFVRPTGSTGVADICRPRDPIVVNTAN